MERRLWKEEDIVMEGYLEKKSTEGIKHLRMWNKRYFILYPTELRYYRKMTVSSFGKTYNDLRGIIPLGAESVGNITVTRGSNHSGKKSSLRFDVVCERHEGQKLASSDHGMLEYKSYSLRAPSSDEADMWVINIRKAHAGKLGKKKKKKKSGSKHSKHHVKKFKKKRAAKMQAAPPPEPQPGRRRRYSLVDDVLETIDDKYATPVGGQYEQDVSYSNIDQNATYARGPLPQAPPGIRNMNSKYDNVKPRYDPNIHDLPATRGRGFSKVGEILREGPILDQHYVSYTDGRSSDSYSTRSIPQHKIQKTKLKHKPPPGIRTASMQKMSISGNTVSFSSTGGQTLSSVAEDGDYEYDPGFDRTYDSNRGYRNKLPRPPAGIRTASQMNLLK